MNGIRFAVNLLTFFMLAACQSLDLNDPKENLNARIKMQGSLKSGEQTTAYWNGTVYAYRPQLAPGHRLTRLFNFNGINVNRKLKQTDGSWLSLSREVSFYRDLNSGEILESWMNPLTSQLNEVFTVNNDPVNSRSTPGVAEWELYNNATVSFPFPIVLEYPNPLQPENYSRYSAGQVYSGAEIFDYFTSLAELADPRRESCGFTGSWSRVSQYLPWFEMSTTPGYLVYHAEMVKLVDGLSELPKYFLNAIQKHYPKFLTAPTKIERPNQTSWSVFKNIIDARRRAGQPDIQPPQMPVLPANHSRVGDYIDPDLLDLLVEPIWLLGSGTVNPLVYASTFNTWFKSWLLVSACVYRTTSWSVKLRAVNVLRDVTSGDIISSWRNPITKAVVSVRAQALDTSLNLTDFASVRTQNYSDVSVLSAETELFNALSTISLFLPRDSNGDIDLNNMYGTWARFDRWLDWMQMPKEQNGLLLYNINFQNLRQGVNDVPEQLKTYIQQHYSGYLQPVTC